MHKRRFLIVLLSMAFALAALALRTRGDALAQAIATGELVRLHVIAEGDTPEQQAVKFRVRNAVVERMGEYLSDVHSKRDALAALDARLDEIERIARDEARLWGFEGEVTATLSRENFPLKQYRGREVPAGEYDALRIVLGGGQGRNWWCVLYPQYCLLTPADGQAAVARVDEPSLDAPVAYRSLMLDWLHGLFGGDAHAQ